MIKPGFFILLISLIGCVHRSNDALVEVSDAWVDEEYILAQEGSSESLALLKARQLTRQSDYREAWQTLNDPSLRLVVNPEYSFIKGKIQFEFGDYVQAARYLEDAEQLGYTGYEMYVLLARVNLALERQENALDITRILVDQRPDAMNLNLRAQVLAATGDTLQARNHFQRSLRADSAIRENYLGLGRIYQYEKKYDTALDLIASGMKHFPGDEELIRLSATIQEQNGDVRGALSGTDQLLGKHPNEPELLAWRAGLYMKTRQYDSAVYAATTSLVYSNDPETRLILATALERQRLYSDALQEYQTVYEVDSTNAVAADGVRRLEGRRRYLDYLRKQRQDSVRQQNQRDSTSSNPFN